MLERWTRKPAPIDPVAETARYMLESGALVSKLDDLQ